MDESVVCLSMKEKGGGHFLYSTSLHFGSLQQPSKYPENIRICKQVIVCEQSFKLWLQFGQDRCEKLQTNMVDEAITVVMWLQRTQKP